MTAPSAVSDEHAGGDALRSYGTALGAGYKQQLRASIRRSGQAAVVIAALPQAVVFGWLLHNAGDDRLLARIALGQVLLAAWTTSVLTLAWILDIEAASGTFELGVASPAPMVVTMFGKGIAFVVGGFVGGAASAIALLAMARDVPRIDAPLVTLTAFLVAAVVAVPATAFAVAPVAALSPGARSFINGTIPLGIVLGGFLFPVAALPTWAEVLSRTLPLSWATDAMAGAAAGEAVAWVLGRLAAAVALGAVWLVLASLVFARVERRFVSKGSFAA